MTASKLQAENQELRERIRELHYIGVENATLKRQVAALTQEVDRLADIILDKEEKGQ